MPNEEVELATKLHEILNGVSPEQAVIALKRAAQVPVRPKHWTGRSVAPYYDKPHAIIAQKILDKLASLPDLKNRGLLLTTRVFSCSRATIYNKWNQGALFLVENMDTPEGYYAELHERLEVTRSEDGITIALRKPFDLSKIQEIDIAPVAESAKITKQNKQWRKDMESWLDNPDGDAVFVADGLQLSQAVQEELKNSFAGLDTVIVKITDNKVVLRKI